MSHKIEIGLEVGEVKKSLFEISSLLERSFGKNKSFDLFSADTKNLLIKEAANSINKIKTQMDDLGDKTKKYHEILKGINVTDANALRIKSEIVRVEKERARYAADMSKLQKTQRVLGGGGGGGEALAGEAGGEALGGGAAGAIGGPVGIAVGMLTADLVKKVLHYVMIPFNAWGSSVPQRMGLLGRGIENTGGMDKYLTGRLGFGADEIRGAQEQSTGIFGLGASQLDSKDLRRRMQFSRQTGFGIDQVQGAFSGVQAQGGFGQANRTFEEFRATILSNKLEHVLGPYFEAISGVLEQINENGLGLNGEAFESIAKIAGNGQNVSAQQASRLVGGIDSFIKGAQGGVQALLMQGYANKGIGGGTLGGTQSALEYGLFGGGTEGQLQAAGKQGLLGKNDIGMLLKLGFGGAGASRKRAAAIVDELSTQLNRFPGGEALGPQATKAERDQQSGEQFVARGRFLMSATGGKNITEAYERFNALKQVAAATSPEQAEKLSKAYDKQFGDKDIGKIMDTSEGHLAIIESSTKGLLELIGQDIAPAVLKIESLMVDFLGAIDQMLKFFHIADYNPEEKMKQKIERGENVSADEFAKMRPVDQGRTTDYYKEEIGEMNKRLAFDSINNRGLVQYETELRDRAQATLDELLRVNQEQLNTQQDHLDVTKRSTQSRPKAEKNGKQSTMKK